MVGLHRQGYQSMRAQDFNVSVEYKANCISGLNVCQWLFTVIDYYLVLSYSRQTAN